MGSIHVSEKIIEQYIAENNISAAVKSLYGMVVQCAEAKMFSKAEQYREQILEVDPMALNEIINSAEIIEGAKNQAMDPNHMEIWSKLYNVLDTDEQNALYFAMKEAKYEINQTVYSQGDLNSKLYFINNGDLNLIFTHKGGDFYLSNLSSGDVAGQDDFFSNTVCTTTLLTTTNVNLNFIEKNVLLDWRKTYPKLEQKLKNFCLSAQSVADLLKRKKIDRRTPIRINISGIGIFNLLDTSGKPIARPFKGELSDISLGGLSFSIRIPNAKTVQQLIGRRLYTKITFNKSPSKIKINQNGLIVGVFQHPFGDQSVQVKFDKLLDRSVIARLV